MFKSKYLFQGGNISFAKLLSENEVVKLIKWLSEGWKFIERLSDSAD